MTCPGLSAPILTREAGESFISDLHAAGLLFHLDDSPETVGNPGPRGEWISTFTPEECADVAARVAELFRLDWGDFEDPHGFALHVLGHDPAD